MSKKFWNWDSGGGGGERTMFLDGAIAEEGWDDTDVTPDLFRAELFAGDGPVTIWINSPGGDVIAASRIYAMLMDYPHDVIIKIDGVAASAASVVAMAGTTVLMAPTAMMMVHNPATVAVGDKAEMKKAIEMLDEVKESIINAYEIKTGLPRDRISRLMDGETWMNARRAIELGFADGMIEEEKRTVEPMEFSDRTAETMLWNRLKAAAIPTEGAKATEETHTPTPTEEKKRGRAVAELLERLRRIAGEKGESK